MSNESMDVAGHTCKHAVSDIRVKYGPQQTICKTSALQEEIVFNYFLTFDLRSRHVSQACDARGHRFGGRGCPPSEAGGLGRGAGYGPKPVEHPGTAVIVIVGTTVRLVTGGL